MIALLIISIIVGAHYTPKLYKKNNINSYKIVLEGSQLSYTFKNDDDNDNPEFDKFEYEPNLNTMTSFSLGTKYVDIGFTFEGERENSKDDIYDPTNVFDIQLLGVYKNFLWEAYYQNYQGLYILDDEELGELSEQPRANSHSHGLHVKYFTKEGIDIKKSLGHFSIVKESNWSYVHGLFIDRSKLSSSSDSLIPLKYQSSFDQITDLNAIKSTAIGYDFGVAGLKTWESLYISGLLSLGIVGQHLEFEGIDTEGRDITNSTTNVIFDIGYQATNKSIGIQARIQSYNMAVENIDLNKARTITRIYFNYYL